MLPAEFFGQNAHFAICLFAALVFFAVFWLYFDAWLAEPIKKKENIFKWAGFLIVALSFLGQATIIEDANFGPSIFGKASAVAVTIVRLVGYVAIIIGLAIDPLQAQPDLAALTSPAKDTSPADTETTGKKKAKKAKKASAVGLAAANPFGIVYALPAGALLITMLYWRRATTGLERHLRPVVYAFGLLFGFELLSLATLFRNTTNPNIYNLVKAFGPLWIASYALLLLSMIVLGHWVWHYLLERFLSQLFMIFVSMTMVIYLLTTVSFTFLLTRNIQNSTLDNLTTASNVLSYALNSKKAELNAQIDAVANDTEIASAVLSKDHAALSSLTTDFLGPNKLSSLMITTSDAQVLLRDGASEQWGDSVSSDSLVRRALIGEASSSVVTTQGVLAPTVAIRATEPIRDSNQLIIGTVSADTAIDNGFVDDVKQSTGLDSAVYAGNELSATTLVAPDGTSRQIGVEQNNAKVTSMVLDQGHVYKGSLSVLNRPFLAVYTPLKDSNNNVVGMLFIGQPQTTTLRSVGRSIQLTFLVSVGLLLFSTIPAYLVSRHLNNQLK